MPRDAWTRALDAANMARLIVAATAGAVLLVRGGARYLLNGSQAIVTRLSEQSLWQ